MARCLVTGYRGYIGNTLYKKLLDLGHEVMGIDLEDKHDINDFLSAGIDKKSFHPKYFNFKPEFIFHMAYIPRVGYSVENPVETTKNNILITTNVLNFAKEVGAKRVIFSSSSSATGDENGPASPYALQKLYSEMECKLWSRLYGIDTVSLRYFNVYSEDQKARGSYSTAIANWMHYIKENKKPFLNGDGNIRRDMVHLEDVISANIFIMNLQQEFRGEVFDVGTGQNISLKEVIEIIKNYFPQIEFEERPPRSGDLLFTKADTTKLSKLGWNANIKIQEGINFCFKNLKDSMNGKGRANMRNSIGGY